MEPRPFFFWPRITQAPGGLGYYVRWGRSLWLWPNG